MPKYLIKQFEIVVSRYEVEAKNMTEALFDFRSGAAGDYIGPEKDLEIEVCDEYGLSFDELPEDISDDVELLRWEFNNNDGHDYLESIYSIEKIKE